MKSAKERILYVGGANLFRGIEGVGGKLRITDTRILFEPHFFNIQKGNLEIPLKEILLIGKRNTMLLIPNGIYVQLKSGVVYRFVVNERERIIDLITKYIK